ncbi:hypothetical protein [Paenibacillus sp. GCM10012303]
MIVGGYTLGWYVPETSGPASGILAAALSSKVIVWLTTAASPPALAIK